MGCRSDYLEPTERERKNKEAAELICSVYRLEGKEPPAWAEEALHGLFTSRDVEGSLCDLLKNMSDAERNRLIYGDVRSRPRRRLADWWERHLELDEKRNQELRKSGLMKERSKIPPTQAGYYWAFNINEKTWSILKLDQWGVWWTHGWDIPIYNLESEFEWVLMPIEPPQ